MPTNVLTEAQIKRLAPKDKPFKVFDGGGLFLYVSATGKSWRLAYRLGDKQQTHAIGPYPAISLANARIARERLRRDVQAGIPIGKRAVVAQKEMPSLRQITEAYWLTRHDVTDAYKMNAVNALEKYLLSRFGDQPIDQFSREQLMTVLNGMNEQGKFVYLRKLRMWLSQVLDYAIEHQHLETNITRSIRTERAFGKRKVEHFASLELHEVGAFLKRVAMEDEADSALANEILARTWLRTGELRFMKIDDLGTSPGLSGRRLLIPGERMKRDKDLIVPLSKQAEALIDSAILRNRGSDYIFPAAHRVDRPISENTILALIARVGYKGKMTGHGWRSIASTWANEAGYSPDAIERQLAHKPDDGIRATYNRAEYLTERATMMQTWSDWLDQQSQITAQIAPDAPQS